jgi:XRE family aerobic/anaerobic benzoate catabolism transcriptional regulator
MEPDGMRIYKAPAASRADALAAELGARVRARRTDAGLSRKSLAERAGVSERYLVDLEKGEANVSIGLLARVGTALGAEISELLALADAGRPSLPTALAGVIAGMSPAELAGAAGALERYVADRRRALRGIALVGLRGAGKSTVGGLFARHHGLPFLSITREVEARAGMPLADLFNLGGPDAYRAVENEVVAELAGRGDRIVLETAGGIVGNPEALELILARFRTVWLKATPEEHLKRVLQQGDTRPMSGHARALEHVEALLAERVRDYGRADAVIDTSGRTPEACVAELEAVAAPLLADLAATRRPAG